MKHLKFIFTGVIMIMLALSFTACSDDDEDPDDPASLSSLCEKEWKLDNIGGEELTEENDIEYFYFGLDSKGHYKLTDFEGNVRKEVTFTWKSYEKRQLVMVIDNSDKSEEVWTMIYTITDEGNLRTFGGTAYYEFKAE